MKRIAVLFLAFAACAGAARADEAALRKALEPKMGGARIESITPSPVQGLFEVQYRSSEGMQIFYTDAEGTYVVQGKIFDFKQGKDLTEERLRKVNAVSFDKLPLDMAVKVQRGNGKRVLVMFSDPYCPYCKQFEKTLQTMDDITVYVFMYPVIRPQAADHSRSVWCSPDRAKAWVDLALQGKPPSAPPTCDNPVDKTLELGRALRVNSTPTLFLANGERVTGGLRPAELKQVLDRSLPAKR